MLFAEEAFRELFPDRDIPKIEVVYSSRLGAYNSNVRYTSHSLTFNLSSEWRDVDDSIQKGLTQSLMMRVYKSSKKKTNYTDLYDSFMRHLHRSVPKTKSDPALLSSFERVNTKLLYGQMEKPNLVWGGYTKRVLGNYNYHTDTIRISSYFMDAPLELLDYIMYHELLHKQIKFTTSGGRSLHHSRTFRRKEKEFPRAEHLEKEIHSFLRYKRKPREEDVERSGRGRSIRFGEGLLRWFR